MQGRLSPPRDGNIQSFPRESWREEFARAATCGLELIEWIFESDHAAENPVMSDAGIGEMLNLSQRHRVEVISLCADYFMEQPLFGAPADELARRVDALKRLVAQCAKARIRYIGIPFVDHSAIQTADDMDEVSRTLRDCANDASKHGVMLCLETSLAPEPFRELLSAIDHPSVGVNYDIGNSASLGYDPRAELDVYGSSIATVHVKDRVRGGSTVPLGRGDADFKAVFEGLRRLNYRGPFILQAARNGDEISAVRRYTEFLNDLLKH